jgi:hypothetical protein
VCRDRRATAAAGDRSQAWQRSPTTAPSRPPLPPDGDRNEGSAVIAAFFRRLFDTANQRTFDVEEIITVDDRMVMRWSHRWVDKSGVARHVRGVDLFRVATARLPRNCPNGYRRTRYRV